MNLEVKEQTARLADGVEGRDHPFDRAQDRWTAVAAPHALARGVVILVEALSPAQTNVVTSLAEAVEIVERIGSPAVSTMFDTHNAIDEREPHAVLVPALPAIGAAEDLPVAHEQHVLDLAGGIGPQHVNLRAGGDRRRGEREDHRPLHLGIDALLGQFLGGLHEPGQVGTERAERGLAYLEDLWTVVAADGAREGVDRMDQRHGEERAADINAAVSDPEVTALLCAIGGNHTNQVVDHLDYDLIRSNPKVFQGYSDITTLHWALANQAGLRTFHGPALVAELAEYPEVFPYTDRVLQAAWFGTTPIRFEPAHTWTDEFLDWFEKADLERGRQMRPSSGWVCLRPGVAEGR